MGLGLLILASYGKENNILSYNPQVTYFKKVYKKASEISFEIIPQYFKSIPNFNKRLTLNISKNADLIKDMSLYIELPELPPSKHTVLPNGIKKIAWVNKVGLALIKYIDIEIGGILIDRHYSDWLNIDYEANTYKGYDELVGKNIKELTDYTNGKKSYKLYIPLRFFFNLADKLTLPLVSLSKQDVKIHIEFNSFDYCVKESPTHYFEVDDTICLFSKNEFIRQIVDGKISIGEFIYFDLHTKRVYYNKIFNDFEIIKNNNNKYLIRGDKSQFTIFPKIKSIYVKDESYIFSNTPNLKDSSIHVNYIYLNNKERWFFLNNHISYLTPLVENVLEQNIASINKNYRLTFTNLHKIIYWRAQLNSNKENNNHFNYTAYPFNSLSEPLILNSQLIINSIQKTEISNYEFYSFLQSFNNYNFLTDGVFQYSFCINSKNNDPIGTLNFSKLDDAYLKLIFNKFINYQYSLNIKAYGIYYNIFTIKNGTSSMKFYN